MASVPPKLTAEGLTKRFGRLVLYRGLSLEVNGGEALAITGPNGSGKSTLLMMLAGLLSPTEGTVRLSIEGEEVDSHDHPHRVGFVAPYLQLYDDLTALENLLFLYRARRLPDGEERGRALLARVGLAGREHDPVKNYSSGMRQRARFAAALLADPDVLLLDEPGSNLDAPGRAFVQDLVESQRADGRAVVVATNSVEEAAFCPRRIDLA